MCICLNNLLPSTYPPHAHIPPLTVIAYPERYRKPQQGDLHCHGMVQPLRIADRSRWYLHCPWKCAIRIGCGNRSKGTKTIPGDGVRERGLQGAIDGYIPSQPQPYFLSLTPILYLFLCIHTRNYYYNIYNISLYNFRYIMLIQERRIFWG